MSPPRVLGAHRGVAALLTLLTLAAAALVAGLPRVVEGSCDRAVRQAVRENPAELTDLTMTLVPESPRDPLPSADLLAERYDRLRAELPARLRPVLAGGAEAGGTYAVKTYGTPLTDRIGGQHQDLLRVSVRRSVADDEHHLTGLVDAPAVAALPVDPEAITARDAALVTGQARSVTVLQVAPVVAGTAVVGVLLGLALPAVPGPGADVPAAVLGGFAHAAAVRRRSLGSVPRVGETS